LRFVINSRSSRRRGIVSHELSWNSRKEAEDENVETIQLHHLLQEQFLDGMYKTNVELYCLIAVISRLSFATPKCPYVYSYPSKSKVTLIYRLMELNLCEGRRETGNDSVAPSLNRFNRQCIW